ncbi:MAG: CpsD/CapB family tyrosine-protein kinase [Planctomycetes bacterium]|nr:CpsD/CapB family tyrosine-protein kinase [Planctomycetota bacterium]
MSKIERAIERLARERKDRETRDAALRDPASEPTPVVVVAGEQANKASASPRPHPVPHPAEAGSDSPPGTLNMDKSLVAHHAPMSSCREDFRRIQVALHRASQTKPCRVILVTSSIRNEGKSTTAMNLAITICQEMARSVVVVDADMRRPSVGQLIGVKPKKGLADLLESRNGKCLDDIIVQTPVPHLSIVPTPLAQANPAELVNTETMKRIISELRERFSFVIIDSPPLLPVPDATILAKHVDGVILVVEACRTKKQAVVKALEHLHGAPVLGFILNKGEVAIPRKSYDAYGRYAGYYRTSAPIEEARTT